MSNNFRCFFWFNSLFIGAFFALSFPLASHADNGIEQNFACTPISKILASQDFSDQKWKAIESSRQNTQDFLRDSEENILNLLEQGNIADAALNCAYLDHIMDGLEDPCVGDDEKPLVNQAIINTCIGILSNPPRPT